MGLKACELCGKSINRWLEDDLGSNFCSEEHWKEFNKRFREGHKGFITKECKKFVSKKRRDKNEEKREDRSVAKTC